MTRTMNRTDVRREESYPAEGGGEDPADRKVRQVHALALALAFSAQREHQRIAGILYDDLQQTLFGAQMNLRLLDGFIAQSDVDRAAQVLEETSEILRRAIRLCRSVTIDLSPPILAGEGLLEAVEWLAVQMQEMHGLTVEVDVEGDLNVLGAEVRGLLFKCVRELLSNVARHAGVSQARVRIRRNGDHLHLTVEDNGKGFDVLPLESSAPVGERFGLLGVRARLGLLEGGLDVESAPGAGTRASIFVPLALKRVRA